MMKDVKLSGSGKKNTAVNEIHEPTAFINYSVLSTKNAGLKTGISIFIIQCQNDYGSIRLMQKGTIINKPLSLPIAQNFPPDAANNSENQQIDNAHHKPDTPPAAKCDIARSEDNR